MASVDILGGPNKYELMLALFDRSLDRSRPVQFRVLRRKGMQPVDVQVHIISVSIEDGSGESWLVECQSTKTTQYYNGYYSTKSRTGILSAGLRKS